MPRMPLAHGAARALRVVGAHPPADDPARMDPDDLGTHVRVGRVLAGECLGGAADLEAAHRPWADRDEVVDHERGLAVGRDIPELAGVPQVAATNVDHVGLGIGLEPYGAVLQRAVRCLGGQAPEALGPQVLKLGFGEYHVSQTYSPAEHLRRTAEHLRRTAKHLRRTAKHPWRTAEHLRRTAEHPWRTAEHPWRTAEHPWRTAK